MNFGEHFTFHLLVQFVSFVRRAQELAPDMYIYSLCDIATGPNTVCDLDYI